MCLCTKHKEPLVARRNIKVYKHARYIDLQNKIAYSPCQNTKFKLDEDFIPERQTVDMRGLSLYEINGGVIHACLFPDFSRGECLEAYIPEGTKYWIGVDHMTVCAEKLVVLSKPVKLEDNPGIDPIMAEMFYDSSEEKNGVKVGDYLVTTEKGKEVYYKPSQLANVPKERIKGMVVGFNGSTPEVADIFHIIKSVMIDSEWDSTLDKHISNSYKAEKDMDGYKHTIAWEAVCKSNKSRFEAYHAVKELGDDHYIPALGEMKLFMDNILTIAASCAIVGFFLPIQMGQVFWSSTEFSLRDCWDCRIRIDGWRRYCYYKYDRDSIVPFVASAQMKKKNRVKRWITRATGFIRKLTQ